MMVVVDAMLFVGKLVVVATTTVVAGAVVAIAAAAAHGIWFGWSGELSSAQAI